MTIQLRLATQAELSSFIPMEQDAETAVFIAPYTLAKHQETFAQPDINYLAIVQDKTIVGFMLTGLDPDGVSVELRRIVVALQGQGVGQAALKQLEQHCQAVWQRKRIWLDVFTDNERGLHIYTKLGYTFFAEGLFAGRPIYFYEKLL